MKKALTITALVIVNIILTAIAIFIYVKFSLKIIWITEIPQYFNFLLLFLIIFVGFASLFYRRKFKNLGFGLTSLLFSCLVFLFFYTNKSFPIAQEYRHIRLENAIWKDDIFTLEVSFNNSTKSIEVPMDVCLAVDSVEVRFDRGIFNLHTITNHVRISENKNCNKFIDSTGIQNKDLGHNLAAKRCFSMAINEYSKCIQLDSTNEDCYYYRGLMFMVNKNYKNALNDFKAAASLRYTQISKSEKNIITNINNIDKIDTYSKRIQYCKQKLEWK